MKIWKLILGVAGGIVVALFILNLPFMLAGLQGKPKIATVEALTPGSHEAHGADSVRLMDMAKHPEKYGNGSDDTTFHATTTQQVNIQ